MAEGDLTFQRIPVRRFLFTFWKSKGGNRKKVPQRTAETNKQDDHGEPKPEECRIEGAWKSGKTEGETQWELYQ